MSRNKHSTKPLVENYPRVANEVIALSALIEDFSNALCKTVISKYIEKKRTGWDTEEWDIDDIKQQLIEHIKKGDPLDVAAYAAFWWNKS